MDKIMFHINSLIRAGAERVISNLAGQFAENGYEVILATEWYDENEYELNPKVNRLHVGLTEKDQTKSRISKAMLRISRLKQAIKNEKPDLVVAFTRKPIYRALMATYTLATPVIIAVRCNPEGTYDTKSSKLMSRLLFKNAAGAVFQTTQIRDFFPAVYKEKPAVIWNPISDNFFNQTRSYDVKKEIVCVNRFATYKNQRMLAEAFYEVHQSAPDYILKFYGEDSGDGEEAAVKQFIRENGAQEYIKIMNNTKEVEKVLRDVAVFVLPSKEEGQPNVLMEAMALGLPVISTDCKGGGARDLIKHKQNGLLVPNDNKEEMAKAILYLIKNRQQAEYMGLEAAKIKEQANSKIIFREWERYIQTILGKR